MIVEVAVELLSYSCDKLYSYNVPCEIVDSIKVGKRIIIPFGKNQKKCGLIIEICESDDGEINDLKNICAVLDEVPQVSAEMIYLIKEIRNRCFCTYFDVAKLIFPPWIRNISDNIKYKLNSGTTSELKKYDFSLEQKEFVNLFLNNKNGTITLKKLLKQNIKNFNKILQYFLDEKIMIEEFDLSKNSVEKFVKVYRISDDLNDISDLKLTEKQKCVLEFLKKSEEAAVKEITYFTGIGESVVKTLLKKNIIEEKKIVKHDSINLNFEFYSENKNYKKNILNSEQKSASEKLLDIYNKNEFSVSVIQGVTGSGKTEVLLNLVDLVISQNKSVIFMVPEISLTSQFIEIFNKRYPGKLAMVHSNLKISEKNYYYKKICDGKAKIVLGARSAVFAQVKNLGLIIIDEEHEFTYKSDSNPRFNAKEVAKIRCKYNGVPLIFSSATPSVECYYNAIKGKYHLCKLSSRYGKSELPNVEIVDMNEEGALQDTNQFGKTLIEALRENFKNNKQSLIFLNKRGYNTFAKCKHCNTVLTCPNCSVSLKFHKANNRLMCHYCGYSCAFSDKCSKCGHNSINYLGSGTQKAEEFLEEMLPNAKILRIDADTKNLGKANFDSLKKFADGEYDILVGTQIISKGFNFPNLTLVGVLSADQYLYSSDFRSYEKTFSLLTQVIGRAGRSKFPGKAIIQTFTPDNEIFDFVEKQDYEAFFNQEIKIRDAMLYPPFSDICIIGFVSENEKKIKEVSKNFFSHMRQEISNNYRDIPIRILKPIEAMVKKISGKYRYKIVIKCRNNKKFREMLSNIINDFYREYSTYKVKIFVDINPDTIL